MENTDYIQSITTTVTTELSTLKRNIIECLNEITFSNYDTELLTNQLEKIGEISLCYLEFQKTLSEINFTETNQEIVTSAIHGFCDEIYKCFLSCITMWHSKMGTTIGINRTERDVFNDEFVIFQETIEELNTTFLNSCVEKVKVILPTKQICDIKNFFVKFDPKMEDLCNKNFDKFIDSIGKTLNNYVDGNSDKNEIVCLLNINAVFMHPEFEKVIDAYGKKGIFIEFGKGMEEANMVDYNISFNTRFSFGKRLLFVYVDFD